MIHYLDEVVIRLWLGHGGKREGHIAATIRTLDLPPRSPEDMVSTYISWWPAVDDLNKHNTFFTPRKLRTPSPHEQYVLDKQAETNARANMRLRADPAGFLPRPNQKVLAEQRDVDGNIEQAWEVQTIADYKVNLPNFGTTAYYDHQKRGVGLNKQFMGCFEAEDKALEEAIAVGKKLPMHAPIFWGLNLPAMADWWGRFVSDPKNGYQFMSKKYNCVGVVFEALIAAGIEAYVQLKSALFYRTPQDMAAYINLLVAKLDALNLQSAQFQDTHQAFMDEMLKQTHDLWLPHEFERNSRSKKAGFRREQVAAIDQALKEYHKYPAWSEHNLNKKIKSLVTIMDNVLSHRHNKPNSERGYGVMLLGCQVLNLLLLGDSGLNKVLKNNALHTHLTQANTLFHNACAMNNPISGIKAKNR